MLHNTDACTCSTNYSHYTAFIIVLETEMGEKNLLMKALQLVLEDDSFKIKTPAPFKVESQQKSFQSGA